MCFSFFIRDMKVLMDHYLNLGRWRPQYLRGVKAKSTMRGGMRQISRGCVRCRFIATGPKYRFTADGADVLVRAPKCLPVFVVVFF